MFFFLLGLLLTLSEIGPILTAVWISHTASYGNRPRWMGFGLMLIATGLFFGFFMNWIFQPPALNTSGTSQTHNNSPELLCRRSLNTPSAKSMTSGERCTIDIVKRRWAFTAWVFMFSLLGEFFFFLSQEGQCLYNFSSFRSTFVLFI